ncbi:MAG: hypothetical protein GWM92_01390 [Gemmatimonadetes bacterium]|nr:hypothetical protein [Gemmatimonadota bacterium]NIR76874.1 hypothetical protein [Gemmatimonadota bacterium]NIT85642.1 hypothetical protein [Gemmatimonadota bacterium]NIU29474.1 hypothetical protein [Gemmatimonadota bacterium]NIU34533.1 hypothetical protein [Gemmatimonadota bacterium]
MSRLVGAIGVLLVLAASMGFAALNSGERVTLDLGLVTLYRLPVTYVAFGGLFVGMLVVLVAGIHSDLKVRRILKERLQEEDREERARMMMERYQRDLFEEEEEG